jgi:hypothetical protein
MPLILSDVDTTAFKKYAYERQACERYMLLRDAGDGTPIRYHAYPHMIRNVTFWAFGGLVPLNFRGGQPPDTPTTLLLFRPPALLCTKTNNPSPGAPNP